MSAASSTEKTSIDPFTALPDCLLTHILSFLEVKRASITSLLSKRWQFLWTQLPRLVFRAGYMETTKFVARVHRTLAIYSRKNLERLEVDFWYSEVFACDVNSWIEFAVRNKVKVFHLLLNSSERGLHTPPEMMYTNSSLTSLFLLGSVVAPPKAIAWRSLTELRIKRTLLSQVVVEKILSGCPVLRGLYIVRCWGFNCLDVKSPSLYKLCVSVRGDSADETSLEMSADETSLEISVPYVLYLEIHHPGERKLCLRNVQSVVRARIELTEMELDPISEELMSNAKELLVKTQHVKELEVQGALFEVMSRLVVNGWQLPQSKRDCLKVCIFAGDEHTHHTSGFLALLESSPNIDKLIIDVFIDVTDKDSVTSGPFARDDLDSDLLNLKTVKVVYFVRPCDIRDQMLTWARILLKRAIILEEMVIQILHEDTSDFVKIRQTLHNYPRSSQKAVIVLREL